MHAVFPLRPSTSSQQDNGRVCTEVLERGGDDCDVGDCEAFLHLHVRSHPAAQILTEAAIFLHARERSAREYAASVVKTQPKGPKFEEYHLRVASPFVLFVTLRQTR
jgi:hypothetical protein